MLAEVSPTGTITSSRNYDVYGNVRSGVNANGTSAHKFVGNLGHPSDNNSGLIYMQARYMDPATGRFVSEDPGMHGRNWFAYCHADPVNYHDRTGKDEDIISCEVGMSMDALMGEIFEGMGIEGEICGSASMVEGQILTGNARYIVANLIQDLGLKISASDFSMWAVETMGAAGSQFLKAWVVINAEEETALYYLDGDQGEIFASHETPYVGNLNNQ